MFCTVPEAVQACRETYRDHRYQMMNHDTGEIIEGSAAAIYLRWRTDEQKREPSDWQPIDEKDEAGWALCEVIGCGFSRVPYFPWEHDAIVLLNQIADEVQTQKNLYRISFDSATSKQLCATMFYGTEPELKQYLYMLERHGNSRVDAVLVET